jgi:hypothetical protein
VALGGDAQLVESIGHKAEPGVPSSTSGGKQAQTEPRAVIRFGLVAKNPHIAHPIKEDVKKKFFSVPPEGTQGW